VLDCQWFDKAFSPKFGIDSSIFGTAIPLTWNCKTLIIELMRSRGIKAKVVFYDSLTGEVLEEFEQAIFIGKKPYLDRGYVKVFIAFLSDVLEDELLGTGAWRLLLYAMERLNYDTLIVPISPKEVMAKLDIGKTTFYRWLNILLSRGYLEKLDTNIYRLKPYSAVKGQMSKAIETEPDF
jgi:hypothetical protein